MRMTLTAVTLLTTACGSAPAGLQTPLAGPPATPEPTSCPNGGKLIKAVETPAVHADPVHIPEATISGRTIPAVTLPAVDIPAQRVPAQCVDVTPAPGGCLSAVSIPAVSIPGTRIPEAEIPGVDAEGIKLRPVRAKAVTAEAVKADAVSTSQEICQSGVTRPGIARPRITRHRIARIGITRHRACNAKNECVPRVDVPRIDVPQVDVPRVVVPPARITQRDLGQFKLFKGKGVIAYTIKADVLFDSNKTDLRPAADTVLARIAAFITKKVPTTIQVDGHTDAKGDDTANQRLSEARAHAIAEWLATKGGIDRSRLKATGYGETRPAAENHRMVISTQHP
ncbi:OmpA family protein [Actinomadura rudentiformis]|uniref:OmpA family protein n=1 Tax=Actinomadura rudentiformis TaxID=359158 RepID=A0A6H9YBB3_9ACTN|nr:OmpA family protein [Actinomadura rudentiformis]KAB2341243.1 OmpA family protein [Actinomadura rudentiformis]